MSNVDTQKYVEFVDAVTSQPSKDHEAFISRLQEIEGQGFHSERLLTAAVGMCAEAGEFTEVVKKIIFQGKPCLLYTSPSPRDVEESRMPSSA